VERDECSLERLLIGLEWLFKWQFILLKSKVEWMLGRPIYCPYRDSSKALCLTIIYKCVIFNNFQGNIEWLLNGFPFLIEGYVLIS